MTVAGGEAALPATESAARPSLPLGPVPRPGGRQFLDITRVDVLWLLVLVGVAFMVRVASPIYPDFLSSSGTNHGVSAWGAGFPLNHDGCIPDVPVGPQHKPVKVCGFVFDEVYFPVDAAKDVAGVDYFDPEPPLAKLLMAPPLVIGGFNSGSWRTTTLICGSLLVGLVYLIARRLRRERFFAVAAATFVCFDGLAFVESRTGVIDIIAIMFAALLWYAFLLHWQARTRKQWTATLYFMALCAGLAFGAKLTALAPLIVAVVLILGRFLEPAAMRTLPPLRRLRGDRAGEAAMWRDSAGGGRAMGHYILASVVAVSIFSATFSRYLSYAHDTVYHFSDCTQAQGLTLASTGHQRVPSSPLDIVTAERNIIEVMQAGLQYHAAECHGHPYASDWYTWPVIEHPVLFYADYKSFTTAAGTAERGWITDMGNPAVWWLAIPALLYCLWKALGGRGGRRLLVATAGVVGFGMLNLAAFGFHVSGLRFLGIPVLIVGLAYAYERVWPVLVGSLGLVALEEMITHYQRAPRFDLVRVDLGLGFKVAFAAMILFGALLVVNAVVSRRFVPSFILLGYLSAWLMWVQGNERRVLFFYHMLGALLFMALALAYATSALRRAHIAWGGRRIPLSSLAYAVVALVIVAFVFFYPVWTGAPETASDFMTRIWLAGWQ